MTWRYRLGLSVLALSFLLLALSIVIVPPQQPHAAVTTHVFTTGVWGVLFGALAVALAVSVALNRTEWVGVCLAGLFGLTSAYAFAAWAVVFHEHTGWQVASRVTGLAAAHGLLMYAGPVRQDRE